VGESIGLEQCPSAFRDGGHCANLQSGTRSLAATLPEERRKGAAAVEALNTVTSGLIEQLDEWQALV
jgi:hypothetical protein